MSIAVACNVPDGVVLGADSAITVGMPDNPGVVAKVFEDAEKVFALHQGPETNLVGCFVGAATYGLGILGARTVEAHIRDFCDSEKGDHIPGWTVEQVSAELRQWLATVFDEQVRPSIEQAHGVPFDRIPAERKPALGVVVAGYSPRGPSPEVWNIQIPKTGGSEEIKQYKPPGQFGVSWWGVIHPVTRFIKGFDPGLLDQLVKHLSGRFHFSVAEGDKREIAEVVNKGEYAVPYQAMSLQEAVNLTKFLLSLPINFAHFAVGAPVCGGQIRVAVISKRAGFQWVQRPELQVRLV